MVRSREEQAAFNVAKWKAGGGLDIPEREKSGRCAGAREVPTLTERINSTASLSLIHPHTRQLHCTIPCHKMNWTGVWVNVTPNPEPYTLNPKPVQVRKVAPAPYPCTQYPKP